VGGKLGSCGLLVCKLPQADNTTAVSTQAQHIPARLSQPPHTARPAGLPARESIPCIFCMYSSNLIDNDSHLNYTEHFFNPPTPAP
jgi:hypothetical protein